MLEAFYIFTKGGVVLFKWAIGQLAGSPVDAWVESVLLEGKNAGQQRVDIQAHGNAYALSWRLHNAQGLVLLAVQQSMFKANWVELLLDSVSSRLTAEMENEGLLEPPDRFEESFDKMMRRAQASEGSTTQKPKAERLSTTKEERAPQSKGKGEIGIRKGNEGAQVHEAEEASESKSNENDKSEAEEANAKEGAFDVRRLKEKNTTAAKQAKQKRSDKSKGKKSGRKWGDTQADAGSLDMTDESMQGPDKIDISEASRMDESEKEGAMEADEGDDEDDDKDDDEGDAADSGPRKRSWISSMGAVLGGSTLTRGREEIDPVVEKVKGKLMEKNVAMESATSLSATVAASLEGTKLSTFTPLSKAVRSTMGDALARILTPTRSTDILRSVKAKAEKGKPFSIVFAGVNGVGKSTTLAKVAYWLLQHDISVHVAACDTFRAGAVEQLRTHCKRLDIPLFERGYEKDAAGVAKDALLRAEREKAGCLLIDTAGRMQHNEQLMRELSRLVSSNQPDMVLFVGEALVGNDAVDQLKEFSRKLEALSPQNEKGRKIDGIALTKLDAVEDKAGAAVSMAHSSGAPILFAGCGQTYQDLRQLDSGHIAGLLLK